MPKRFKDRNKSLFVKFYDDVVEEEIGDLLSSLNVSGTRVSNLINRWAIEIPFWKEGHFIEKFYESDIVERIHESFNRKRVNRDQEENDE